MCNTEIKKNLFEFSKKLISVWENDENEEEIFEEFKTLNKNEAIELIDCFLSELEEIKVINRLIRMKETLNVIFDIKLLYSTIKSSILEV